MSTEREELDALEEVERWVRGIEDGAPLKPALQAVVRMARGYRKQEPVIDGDYHEGFEEGFSVGARMAGEAAVAAARRYAGNGLMDFDDRHTIIIDRVRQAARAVTNGDKQ